ncbi:Rna-directed rna polymerase l, partial [Thalictrum thalictroides]
MHAATLKGFDPIVPYLITMVEVSLLLKRESQYSINLEGQIGTVIKKNRVVVDNDFISFLLMLPSSFSGLPIMCPLELLYCGHPDPSTAELVWVKWLTSCEILEAQKIIRWITSRLWKNADINSKMIIQDPTAINVIRPQQAVNLLRTTLEQALEAKAINHDIKKLMSSYDKNSYDDLCTYLMTIVPCVPRDPYWGSGTIEKKTTPLLKITGTDRALDAAKRSSRVKMWVVDPDSKVGDFIQELISSRTELNEKLLELVSGVYFGGSVTH